MDNKNYTEELNSELLGKLNKLVGYKFNRK